MKILELNRVLDTLTSYSLGVVLSSTLWRTITFHKTQLNLSILDHWESGKKNALSSLSFCIQSFVRIWVQFVLDLLKIMQYVVIKLWSVTFVLFTHWYKYTQFVNIFQNKPNRVHNELFLECILHTGLSCCVSRNSL